MTNILIGVIGLVVAVAIVTALFGLKRKPGEKCNDHSGHCGCGSDGGGGDGHNHSSDGSHSRDAGGGSQ